MGKRKTAILLGKKKRFGEKTAKKRRKNGEKTAKTSGIFDGDAALRSTSSEIAVKWRKRRRLDATRERTRD